MEGSFVGTAWRIIHITLGDVDNVSLLIFESRISGEMIILGEGIGDTSDAGQFADSSKWHLAVAIARVNVLT